MIGSLRFGIYRLPRWKYPVSAVLDFFHMWNRLRQENAIRTRLVWTLSLTFELHKKRLFSWSSERVSISLYTGILDLVWVLSSSGVSDGGCISGTIMLSRWAERLPARVACLCYGTSGNMLHVHIRFWGNFWLQGKRFLIWFLFTLWETRAHC